MIQNKQDAKQIAEILLNINAVKLQPSNFFTWSSGKKSPIYCDNRVLLSHINERTIIRDLFCKCIRTHFHNVNYIAGVATGAIAHGIMIAEQLNLPFVYVRGEAKGHGRKNQIEGNLIKNSNVLVIEDLISTGGSSLKAIEAIQHHGSNVIGLLSIFTYGFCKMDIENIPFFSLCDYSTLIEVAINSKIIQQNEKNILFEWQEKMTNSIKT
jgi:orotate phosphoribosyltransferase